MINDLLCPKKWNKCFESCFKRMQTRIDLHEQYFVKPRNQYRVKMQRMCFNQVLIIDFIKLIIDETKVAQKLPLRKKYCPFQGTSVGTFGPSCRRHISLFSQQLALFLVSNVFSSVSLVDI